MGYNRRLQVDNRFMISSFRNLPR